MIKNLLIKIAACQLILMLSLCLHGTGFAKIGIGIRDKYISSSEMPGSSYGGEIEIFNPGDVPIKVKVKIRDWIYEYLPDGSRRIVFKEKGIIKDSCSEWISVIPSQFELQINESRKVNYIVNLSKNASGGYYSNILFSATKLYEVREAEPGKRIMIAAASPAISVMMYQDIKGTIIRKAFLDFLRISRPSKDSPFDIELQLKNLGNTYIFFEGTYHILSTDGTVYGSGEIRPFVLRQGESWVRSMEWLGNLPKGNYDIIATFELSNGRDEPEQIIVKEAKITVDENGKVQWIKN